MLKREYSQNFHANRAIEAVLKFCEMNEIAVNIANFQWKEFFAIKEAEHQLEEIDIRTLGVSDQIEILNLHNELILQSYYSYFKDTFSSTNPLIKGRHIELLCDLLTLAVMGLIKTGGHGTNIVINMPPRHLNRSRKIQKIIILIIKYFNYDSFFYCFYKSNKKGLLCFIALLKILTI